MGDFTLTPTTHEKMNIHHELIDEYAKDWKITSEPWKFWEHRRKGDCQWLQKQSHPHWSDEYEYRRKLRTIRIGNYDVPDPLRVAPEIGTFYYMASFGVNSGYDEFTYDGGHFDKCVLERGMMHLTREAAELHAKALISLAEQ